MKLYKEISIRKHADEPTLAMLDLWRSLSEHKTGVPIEVMVGNRREHKQLGSFRGELNTAYPSVHDGKPILVLWMDSFSNVKPLIIAHELGHWVLNLQGFHSFNYRPSKNSNIEILLNSMASHVPLYALQRSLGHKPDDEIDSRALHNIKLFATKVKSEKNIMANALMLADDIMNCSSGNRTSLLNVINRNYSKTSKYIKEIMNLGSTFDLLFPDQNLAFRKKIIEQLDLSKNWYEVRNSESLISLVEKSRK